jgi:hypothetical protein
MARSSLAEIGLYDRADSPWQGTEGSHTGAAASSVKRDMMIADTIDDGQNGSCRGIR